MAGRTVAEIAEVRTVAVSTVRSQVRKILQKLGTTSQLTAVAMARQAGWRPQTEGDDPYSADLVALGIRSER